MKTYRTPGATATEWSPTGKPQEAGRLEELTSMDMTTAVVPVTLSLKGETTRKGIRRVVLQAATQVPGTLMNDTVYGTSADPKASVPVSVHIVFQGPQLVIQREAAVSPFGRTGYAGLLQKMTQDIIAVLSNESTTSSSDLMGSGLIVKALCGDQPLDLFAGSYGESSARA